MLRFSWVGFEEVLKAIQHKYLRKTKGASGKWRYVYADKKGDRHSDNHLVSAAKLLLKDEHLHVGAAFSLGSGKGHAIVDKIENGKITYHNDDVDGKETPGPSVELSRDEFASLVHTAHGEAAKKHAELGMEKRLDVLARARKVNPEGKHAKRAETEVKRWQTVHKERISEKGHKKAGEALEQAEKARKQVATEKRLKDNLVEKYAEILGSRAGAIKLAGLVTEIQPLGWDVRKLEKEKETELVLNGPSSVWISLTSKNGKWFVDKWQTNHELKQVQDFNNRRVNRQIVSLREDTFVGAIPDSDGNRSHDHLSSAIFAIKEYAKNNVSTATELDEKRKEQARKEIAEHEARNKDLGTGFGSDEPAPKRVGWRERQEREREEQITERLNTKRIHEKTREQYIKEQRDEYNKKTKPVGRYERRDSFDSLHEQQARDRHETDVIEALKRGMNVPAEVLKDYPGIKDRPLIKAALAAEGKGSDELSADEQRQREEAARKSAEARKKAEEEKPTQQEKPAIPPEEKIVEGRDFADMKDKMEAANKEREEQKKKDLETADRLLQAATEMEAAGADPEKIKQAREKAAKIQAGKGVFVRTSSQALLDEWEKQKPPAKVVEPAEEKAKVVEPEPSPVAPPEPPKEAPKKDEEAPQKETKPPSPPVENPTLEDAIRAISDKCDGAKTKDHVGFNSTHQDFGNFLAQLPQAMWGEEAEAKAHEILRTYRNQLADAGINYDSLPKPKPVESNRSISDLNSDLWHQVKEHEKQQRIQQGLELERHKDAVEHAATQIEQDKGAVQDGAFPVASTPPNVWDLSPKAIEALENASIINNWENNFLRGKRFKPFSSFSPPQQKILNKIQDSLRNAWDKLPPSDREALHKHATPEPKEAPKGAGENSLAMPKVRSVPAEVWKDWRSKGVIDDFQYNFLVDNKSKPWGKLSEKQQAIILRIKANAEAHWKTNVSLEEQQAFVDKYGKKEEGKAEEGATPTQPVAPVTPADPYGKNNATFEIPKGMQKFKDKGYDLHDYQKKFANWAMDKKTCLCALETGLGKTLGALALFHTLKEKGELHHGIVVAPMSALNSWRKETSQFSDARVVLYHGTPAKRKKILEDYKAGKYDLLLTTYGTARKDHEELAAAKPAGKGMLIIDETQYLKDSTTQQAKALTALGQSQERVVGLSATPQPNRPEEMYAVHDSINPGVLGRSKWQFANRFCHILENRFGKSIGGYNMDRKEELQKALAPLMFAKFRNDPDIASKLPPRHQVVVHIGMDDDTKRAYNKQLDDMINKIRDDKTGQPINPLTNLLRLRQISVSPALLNPEHKGESSKIESIADAVTSHLTNQPDRGAVLFGEFNEGLNLTKQALLDRGIPEAKIAMITGATTVNQRQKIEEDLNSGKIQVLIANIKAMQTGANLQGNANFVGLIDTPWNPASLTQAIDRVHRSGQKNNVMVYHPIASPMEQHQLEMLKSKLEQSEAAMGSKGESGEILAESIKIPHDKEGFVKFLESMRATA